MSTLTIYDSQFGNTGKVAEAIAAAIPKSKLARVGDTIITLSSYDLLIIGSPVQGGRSTATLQNWITSLPNLKGSRAAVFDTRFQEDKQNIALKLLMKTIGYAAPKIAKSLESKGATLIAPPEGFIVTSKEGPLKTGELERATSWAKSLF